MLSAVEIRTLIDKAEPSLKAMILLAINAGLGNTDCSSLERKHLDLRAGVLDFPRPKTGVDRRAILWTETVEALRVAMDARPEPRDPADSELVFLTRWGRRWARATKSKHDADGKVVQKGGNAVNALSQEFRKLRDDCLPGSTRSYYDLRHVFRTVADGCHDQVAIALVMGHADGTMGGVYRERIDDSRLRVVSDTVHNWLYADATPSE